MKLKMRMASFALVLGTSIMGSAPALWAQGSQSGCGYFTEHKSTASVKPASFLQVSDKAAIVGFWKLQLLLPDGTVLDDGYVTWHSDGTEIMNSGRPPITGNFCMGVWRQTGRAAYKLNHYGLSWDPTGTTLIGPANLREQVVVGNGGSSYSGTFTVDQYDTEGNVLIHLEGTVSAQRITAD
jgi:hypothetical protein